MTPAAVSNELVRLSIGDISLLVIGLQLAAGRLGETPAVTAR
jgi:hypothetical protein